jgi:hypothetical protein
MMTWTEMAVAYFKALAQNFLEEAEENDKKSQLR